MIEAARRALMEDVGSGDITTGALIRPGLRASADIIAGERGVVAGLPAAREVFRMLDKSAEFLPGSEEGKIIEKGARAVKISAEACAVLTGERTALNFLGRLSGIATSAREYAERVKKYGVKIMDTRKTAPGLRALEKYAVAAGGGFNHRMGLYDAVLIKDNHIEAAGGRISGLVKKAREANKAGTRVEVEVTTLRELEDALEGGPDIIMLDNMDPEAVGESVRTVRKRAPGVLIEVSGGMEADIIEKYAAAGVDMISVGALTHSVKNFDFSLVLKEVL